MSDDTYRYGYVEIHLCEECGRAFDVGDEVVTLSDGYVDTDLSYSPNNIRFFHEECWKNSDYMDTGGDR